MAFLDDILEWMKDEEMHQSSYLNNGEWIAHYPVKVVTVHAWGNDYAEGDTESGFYGDTEVTITWLDAAGVKFQTDVRPGDLMASLWSWMIRKWQEYDGPRGDSTGT